MSQAVGTRALFEGVLWDRLSFDGVILGAIGYGVNISAFLATLFWLRRCEKRSWTDHCWTVYAVILFAANTASTAVHIKFSADSFVEHGHADGTLSAYYVEAGTAYMIPAHMATSTVTLILQNGLLLFRCWTIYARKSYASIVPTMVFIVALGSTIASLVLIILRGDRYLTYVQLNTALGFAAQLCTILLTLAIIFRLLRIRHSVRKAVTKPLVPYISLSGILIESAVAYTAGTSAFLIAYVLSAKPRTNLAVSRGHSGTGARAVPHCLANRRKSSSVVGRTGPGAQNFFTDSSGWFSRRGVALLLKS